MWSFLGKEEDLSSKTDVLLYNYECFITISFLVAWGFFVCYIGFSLCGGLARLLLERKKILISVLKVE